MASVTPAHHPFPVPTSPPLPSFADSYGKQSLYHRKARSAACKDAEVFIVALGTMDVVGECVGMPVAAMRKTALDTFEEDEICDTVRNLREICDALRAEGKKVGPWVALITRPCRMVWFDDRLLDRLCDAIVSLTLKYRGGSRTHNPQNAPAPPTKTKFKFFARATANFAPVAPCVFQLRTPTTNGCCSYHLIAYRACSIHCVQQPPLTDRQSLAAVDHENWCPLTVSRIMATWHMAFVLGHRRR